MILTIENFEPFTSYEPNKTLVDSNKFGVHEIIGDDIVTKEITESDFSKYDLTIDIDWDADTIKLLSESYPGYPFVKLITK